MARLNFRRKPKGTMRRTRRPVLTIQGMGVPQAAQSKVELESMMTLQSQDLSVPGTTNAYKTYDSQVRETYKKYNGQADFGSPQTRSIIDLRSALIAGEGVSVSAKNQQTADWIERFITLNNLQGANFVNAVKGTELAGQTLLVLKGDIERRSGESYIKVVRIPYNYKTPYKPVYIDTMLNDEVAYMKIKTDTGWQQLPLSNFEYIRTGGDDYDSEGPVTRVGVTLTDIENYDRAVRDIRRLNHVLARITPVFKTEGKTETEATKKFLDRIKWTIGKAFIGTAAFSYETPGTSAHENLTTELNTGIKNISGATGVPVHWFGYTDLMSNRSTADSLYELIKHATILERGTWEVALYNVLLNAQEMFIDGGGMLTFDKEFEVKLPLIDFAQFMDKVKALSLAFADRAISMDDYRNSLPGIDPLKTATAVEAEEEESINQLIKAGITTPNEGETNGGE